MTDLPAASTAMYNADRVAHAWGITVDEVSPGTATVRMTVTKEMTNGLGVCHGGILFAFADTAMAYGSNSEDVASFSTTASIEWLRPAHEGARLTATSTHIDSRGRNAIHDVVVTDEDGATIALVRGQTLATGKSVIDVSNAHAPQ